MPYKDLHQAPFTVSIITKLEIFEDYAEAWLPTFVMQKNISEVHIFDFFAGPGYDRNDVMALHFGYFKLPKNLNRLSYQPKQRLSFILTSLNRRKSSGEVYVTTEKY